MLLSIKKLHVTIFLVKKYDVDDNACSGLMIQQISLLTDLHEFL